MKYTLLLQKMYINRTFSVHSNEITNIKKYTISPTDILF